LAARTARNSCALVHRIDLALPGTTACRDADFCAGIGLVSAAYKSGRSIIPASIGFDRSAPALRRMTAVPVRIDIFASPKEIEALS
jgi:hypothetical protein